MRTELPEKWYIQVNEKNSLVLNNYRRIVCGSHKEQTVYEGKFLVSKHHKDESCYYGSDDIKERSEYIDYVEITFEEFQRLVLNKSNEIEIILY